MKVRIVRDVHLRHLSPALSAPARGILFEGFEVEVVEEVEGDIVNGNGTWFKNTSGDFIWSGATTARSDADASSADADTPGIAESRITWGLRQLGVTPLWNDPLINSGRGIKVAVIDTGAHINHPDLLGAVQNPATDVINITNGSTTVIDTDGHGTHCAGIIAGRGHTHLSGVAPDCSLYVVKVMNTRNNVLAGDVFMSAIDWCIEKKVDVISISLGRLEDRMGHFQDAITTADQANITVVAAIGNDGVTGNADAGRFPARCERCISVGAVEKNLELTEFTDQFIGLDVCGPGVDMPVLNTNGGILANQEGTSFATPFVAGVIALMKAKAASQGNELSFDQIRQLLIDTSLPQQTNLNYSYRVIQPAAALRAI